MMQAAVFSFSLRGAELSKSVAAYLESIGYEVENSTHAKYAEQANLKSMLPDHNVACQEAFAHCQTIVFVGACGIAVRTIAPFIKNKLVDPAVLSVDERGNFVIPLLAGHIGGANELARCLAIKLGGQACVTTATDVNGLFAVDEWAARNNMVISSLKAAKDFAASLVNGEEVGMYCDERFTIVSELPKQVRQQNRQDMLLPVGMAITLDKECAPFANTLRLMPVAIYLGIGCKRNTPLENIEALVLPELERLHIDKRTIAGIASVDLKKDEQGLLAFAHKLKVPAEFFTAEQLNSLEGDFTPSKFVQSVVGVANVCERSAVYASNKGTLILKKTSLNGVTLAIAVKTVELDFTHTGLKNK